MENLAERLFCDLKNDGIKIEKPFFAVEGTKIGAFPKSHQFNIFGMNDKYCFGEGITWNTDDLEFKLSFTEAYQGLLTNIKSLGKEIKFYSLVIPRNGVVDVKLLEFETVVGRWIKDYLPQVDQILDRWDFMVGEV